MPQPIDPPLSDEELRRLAMFPLDVLPENERVLALDLACSIGRDAADLRPGWETYAAPRRKIQESGRLNGSIGDYYRLFVGPALERGLIAGEAADAWWDEREAMAGVQQLDPRLGAYTRGWDERKWEMAEVIRGVQAGTNPPRADP